MNAHVNLLHESEQRYQGLVSRKFTFRALLGTLASALLLLGSLALYSFFGERQEWKALKTQWQQVEPHYKRYLLQQQGQGRVKNVATELDGWNRGRLPMNAFLLDIQRVAAPYPIQFARLTVMGENTLIQQPAPKRPPDAAADAPAPKPPPPIPARRWQVSISGRVFGPQGYRDVIAFVNKLQNTPGLAELWESVRLQNLARVTGGERRDEQNFTIEAVTKVRKCE
jgi:hypothetical protein